MKYYHRTMTKLKKYKVELIISIFSAIAGLGLGKAADVFLSAPTVDQLIIGFLTLIAFLFIGQMFIIKRSVIWKILSLQERVSQIAGRFIPNQYDERKLYFAEEKHRLIENLIKDVLPDVINKIVTPNTNSNTEIPIIVDSGTTLELFFPRIKLLGLGPNISNAVLQRINISTNSLSGSDAFCKMPGNYLQEDQLHLFGGTQLERYRAVTGTVTTTAMRELGNRFENNESKIIGIVTANWLLVGAAHKKLFFCSTEEGHLDYKRCLAEVADYLIIVAPLGKLLTLDTTDELNTILKLKEEGKPEYDGFEINTLTKRNKDNTIMLTTYRNKSSSILHPHSENLIHAHDKKKHNLYTLCKITRPLQLDYKLSYKEQIELEIPHCYLREHAFRVLQIHKN